jgi:hypothetical protein
VFVQHLVMMDDVKLDGGNLRNAIGEFLKLLFEAFRDDIEVSFDFGGKRPQVLLGCVPPEVFLGCEPPQVCFGGELPQVCFGCELPQVLLGCVPPEIALVRFRSLQAIETAVHVALQFGNRHGCTQGRDHTIVELREPCRCGLVSMGEKPETIFRPAQISPYAHTSTRHKLRRLRIIVRSARVNALDSVRCWCRVRNV